MSDAYDDNFDYSERINKIKSENAKLKEENSILEKMLRKHGVCTVCGEMFEHDVTEPFANCVCFAHRTEWPGDLTPYQELQKEIHELKKLINTPIVDDFLKALPWEAAHQISRWGVEHDSGKTPFDWVFLIGHLATRSAMKFQEGNIEKALHHTITTAAVCLNWHRNISGDNKSMRPGIEPPKNDHAI